GGELSVSVALPNSGRDDTEVFEVADLLGRVPRDSGELTRRPPLLSGRSCAFHPIKPSTGTSTSYLNHVYGTDSVRNQDLRWSPRACAAARERISANLLGRLLLLLRPGRPGATQPSAIR